MRRIVKSIVLAVVLAGPSLANTCTLSSGSYANLAATAGHWTGTGCTGGAYVPTSPDRAIIPASGANLTLASGDSWHLGTSTIGVGVAFTMTAGASAVSYSTFTLSAGATLQVDGFDVSTNYLGFIDQYAHFNVNGYLLGHSTTSVDNMFDCEGICSVIGATVTVPASDINWNNTGSGVILNAPNSATNYNNTYFVGGNLYLYQVWPLDGDHQRVGNATGTGPDTFGNSSLSFTGISCTPACTGGNAIFVTPVSSLAQVVSAGQYYFDGQSGYVYWWQNTGANAVVSFTTHYKYLSFPQWWIQSTFARTYDSLDIENSSLQYLGTMSVDEKFVIFCKNRLTDGAGGVNQSCTIKNNTFLYSNRPIGLDTTVGSAADPIHIDGNTIDLCPGGVAYYYDMCINTVSSPYLSITSNTIQSSDFYFFGDVGSNEVGIEIRNNVIAGNYTARCRGATDSDLVIDGNLIYGYSAAGGDSRNVDGCLGASGHNVIITNNVWVHGFRWINYDDYDTISNNFISQYGHHLLMGPGQLDLKSSSLTVTNNIFTAIPSAGGTALDLGYTGAMWIDSATVAHNTLYATNGFSGTDLSGDGFDNRSSYLMTNINFHSNIISSSTIGVLRSPDAVNFNGRLYYTANGWNDIYSNATQYSLFNQFSTVVGTTNVTGVSLFNPSATLPISGKTLTLTVNSNINQTLTWAGGSPVQLGFSSGTATSGGANTITDTTKIWSTDRSNQNSPGPAWIKILTGTNAGELRAVTLVASTDTLDVSPAWTTPPDNTSTYVLYRTEVLLTAADASTVSAGILWPLIPTTTQSDTNVSISANSFNTDPQFVDPTRSLASWDATQGGPGTEVHALALTQANHGLVKSSILPYLRVGFRPQNTSLATAAYDGTTIGAVPYQASGITPSIQATGRASFSGTIKLK